jgi:cytochrome c-type biogenesis protein CcsB
MVSIACFILALALYLCSTAAYVAAWIGGTTQASRSRLLALAGQALIGAAVLHGVAIGLRWIAAGRPPLSNGFESFSVYAWALAVLFLLAGWARRYAVLGVLVTPLALGSIVVASVLPKQIEPLVPVLRSYWLPIHVGVSFSAYGVFSLAFVVAVAYLLQERALRRPGSGGWGRQLPSLERLDRSARRLALAGLVLMTGSLLTGSLWAEKAWGVVWVWQPQQVAALVTWAIYAIYFFARHNAGWRDRRAAWLLVAGFLSVLVTFIGADLVMPGSLHGFLFG